MKDVRVKDLTLGAGTGALCIPLTAKDEEALEKTLQLAAAAPHDLVEWRADLWRSGFRKKDGSLNLGLPGELFSKIRAKLGRTPVLFTYRTLAEGGRGELPGEDVITLLKAAAAAGADLVDVEMALAGNDASSLADEIRENGAKVIFSFHDFGKTPPEEEMLKTLLDMQEKGADISKIAVMPRSDEDVLHVLNVCLKMKQAKADRPYIVIAMGERGMMTRFCCSFTGSALTFGTAAGASAPGQVSADLMQKIRSVQGEYGRENTDKRR